jgi:hypothetical protein
MQDYMRTSHKCLIILPFFLGRQRIQCNLFRTKWSKKELSWTIKEYQTGWT